MNLPQPVSQLLQSVAPTLLASISLPPPAKILAAAVARFGDAMRVSAPDNWAGADGSVPSYAAGFAAAASAAAGAETHSGEPTVERSPERPRETTERPGRD